MAEETISPVEPVAEVAQVPQVSPVQSPVISNTPYTISPSQAKATLDTYGINANDVLSADNIQQTVNSPAAAPGDLLGIRSDIYKSQGVTEAEQKYINAQKAASDAALGLSERLTGLRGRPVSLSKITGTQAQERLVSQGEIDALNEAARIAQLEYSTKKASADEEFNIRNQEISEKKQLMAQYPGAGIKFSDSFEKSLKKVEEYGEAQEKKAYKAELKKQLQALGKKTSGLSTKELEKKLSKYNKAAIVRAEEEANLRLEALRLDVANTRSTIASRGSASQEKLVPYYFVDSKTGKIQQAFNEEDGSPVMIPESAMIRTLSPAEENPFANIPEDNGGASGDGDIIKSIKNWWGNLF